MAVIEGATSGALVEVGDGTKSLRVELRPTNISTLGSYSLVANSGTMAAGMTGNSTLYSCRWTDATRVMLLRRLGLVARNQGTAFSAGVFTFELFVARSFTASDSAGTSILPTGNSQKKRTSMGTTLVGDLRISSTTGLTAGTRTLDGLPINSVRGFLPGTQSQYPIVAKSNVIVPGAGTVSYCMEWVDLFALDISTEWPLVLVQNEGFIIRGTVPGSGTWDFSVLQEWSEIASTEGFN